LEFPVFSLADYVLRAFTNHLSDFLKLHQIMSVAI